MKTTNFNSRYREIRTNSKRGAEQPALVDFYRREIGETRDFVTALVESGRKGTLEGRVAPCEESKGCGQGRSR